MTPLDVKSMNGNQLLELAHSVRGKILHVVSSNGGHLAASLGAVEIAIALLRAFDTPADKILWDVGHQAYAWKILTGRKEGFSTLRKHGGLSGFPNPSESEHDAFVAGHAGSALAAALGIAAARDRIGGGHVVAVVGDASIVNGVSLEALCNCASITGRLIVILNDNSLSAPKKPFFESLGMSCIGPIDGHDLKELDSALMAAKKADRPVLLHVTTTKGKGFPPAENDPAAWHGVGPFDIDNALNGGPAPDEKENTWSDVFCEAMVQAARKDDKICAVVAAMRDGTGLSEFAKEFPGRFFDVGICEEMAVAFAAGLAKSGLKPVVAIYSTFLQRAIDQIQHDVCLQGLPVVFAVDRAGCVGADGFTHHGLYDIALLRPLLGMSILSPASAEEMKEALQNAIAAGGPVAIRYPRGRIPLSAETVDIKDGMAESKIEVSILAVGEQVSKAKKVKALLSDEGISSEIIPVGKIKPFQFAKKDGVLSATIENGVVSGGFGESIGADLKFGWPDSLVAHGTVEELEKEHGFDSVSIASKIIRVLKDGR
ncbi:MAG: 1-deoxy-D-xylulose-5-phosphate synthase [Kiritimatiellae bacterium]|nr:1-deoxy-D-xylulose-5-phosphate synthase [Kiritimatiellia bacterium]